MADQPTQSASPFPLPPPFYKHFTPANRTKLQQAQRAATTEAADPDSKLKIDPLSLPTELRYLLPPPVPTSGHYLTFGTTIDQSAATPTLADADIEQLFPSPSTDPSAPPFNPQPHLLALARSLLTTFLSLTGALAADPTQFESRTKELQTLTFNLHDLINRYRPHQARETLILALEERVAARKEETRAIREAAEKVRVMLEGLKDAGGSVGGAVTAGRTAGGDEVRIEENEGEKQKDVAGEKRVARQKALWAKLEGLKDIEFEEEEKQEEIAETTQPKEEQTQDSVEVKEEETENKEGEGEAMAT